MAKRRHEVGKPDNKKEKDSGGKGVHEKRKQPGENRFDTTGGIRQLQLGDQFSSKRR